MIKKIFGILQEIGKALMLPVAILPGAGILLGLGIAIQTDQFVSFLPFLENEIIQLIAEIMKQAGKIIFDNLPLLFAVGVAVGLTNGSGVAALSAIVGSLIMNQTTSAFLGLTIQTVINNNDPRYTLFLGIPTMQTGVFGGVIVGVLAATLYNKFYNMKLPQFLSFFAGKRFVPIITGAFSILLGLLMTIIWTPIQDGLNIFSNFIIQSNLTLAAFVFGVIQRGLIPFGLHHIFYSPFWYEFGEYINLEGQVIHGDQRIFFAQLVDNVELTAGTFMTGKFPIMMFGLPAAALAIYHEAKPKYKKHVGGIMLTGALTSFLTGITEPIEFSFLFVSPLLFIIHTILAGFSFMIMHLLNVKIGLTFSGGLIDFLLFGVLQNRTRWYLVIVVGIGFSIIYYFLFRFFIRYFNLKTPGRSDESEERIVLNQDQNSLAVKIVEFLGGPNNIKVIDSCITRLRIQVFDINQVHKKQLERLGATGILFIGNNIQAIFGPTSDQIKTDINQFLSKVKDEVLIKTKNYPFVSPLSGKLISLKAVPDVIFSNKIMGDGFAIIPNSGLLVSPVDGMVAFIYPTKHAIGIKSENGIEILIHLGLDTVNLNGEGFHILVNVGDQINLGQLLMKVDLKVIRSNNLSLVTPIIFTNADFNFNKFSVKNIKRGQFLFEFDEACNWE
ncbi:MAG: system, glucose-specific component [Haloplasmataceae bacterium]|jgi:PTS system D-glucosamine-specific IIC component|nr:system, glucose-specific component [Haloplasmataceae bacterium]